MRGLAGGGPGAGTDVGSDGLARFLDAAQAARPRPSDDLMARLLADAQTAQPRPASGGKAPGGTARARDGRIGRLLDALGGWGGLGGLTAAGLTGLWIGFAAPGPLAGLAERLPGLALDGAADAADPMLVELVAPDFGDYLTEG